MINMNFVSDSERGPYVLYKYNSTLVSGSERVPYVLYGYNITLGTSLVYWAIWRV